MPDPVTWELVRKLGRGIRIHGNGFIQIDLHGRPDERVHVFGHPKVPRQVQPTPIHDHRFGFESTILSGCLVNVTWKCVVGTPNVYTHDVCVFDPPPGSEDTKLYKTGDIVFAVAEHSVVLTTGMRYSVSPARFHETFANETTITHMVKRETRSDHRPRVLCRAGTEPDNSFNRYKMLSVQQLWQIVEDAFHAAGI